MFQTDQLFQGLGLGSYIEEKDVSKTASEFLPATVSPVEKPKNPLSNNVIQVLLHQDEKREKLFN